MTNPTGIGASILRKEDRRFLSGRGTYVSDIERPDMTFGVFVRSPHAHARIRAVDPTAALALPGVAAVLTGDDLKRDGIGGIPCGWCVTGKGGVPMKEPSHPALAQGKVRHVGDAVAFVIADTLAEARDAAAAVAVEYDDLPAVADVLGALKVGAPVIFDEIPNNICYDWDLGDLEATEAALKKADHVARVKLVNNRLVGNPMEPRAAIGEYNRATEQHTLWTTSQFPHIVKLLMGNFVLKIPQHKLRVVAPARGLSVRLTTLPGHHHFSILDELARPDGALTHALMNLIKIGHPSSRPPA
jgi:aerobic carbon-monoxide dehydrogenase large subunit